MTDSRRPSDPARTKIAADALQSRGTGGRKWTPPTPDPADRSAEKSYGTDRSHPDPNAIRSPRQTPVTR